MDKSLRIGKKQLHLLSPFDNAVIQRKRIKSIFGFDYQTEIYLPPPKRTYGYFSQPVLYGSEFIGRIDPKALRDEGVLLVRNLVLEPGVTTDEVLVSQLAARLQAFAAFNGCESVHLEQCPDAKLRRALKAQGIKSRGSE